MPRAAGPAGLGPDFRPRDSALRQNRSPFASRNWLPTGRIRVHMV